MTSLRQDSLGRQSEIDIVSSFVGMIEFGGLWDVLSESLDFVRELEGIIDVEPRLDDVDMDLSGDMNHSLNRSGLYFYLSQSQSLLPQTHCSFVSLSF